MPEALTKPGVSFLRARRFGSSSGHRNLSVSQSVVQGAHRLWVRYRVRLHILLLALGSYPSWAQAIKATRGMMRFKEEVYGGGDIKMVRCGRQYYFSIYAPGYPSAAFDDYIRSELHRFVPMARKANRLSFLFFAVTRRCPLQCEHCFEWERLNGEETFTQPELQAVVAHYQQEGVSQFHLSGGEPMVRFSDLEALIAGADKKSEFWILTSGLNLTRENARRLKSAGATGVVVSLDHFDAGAHNTFRGSRHAHQWVVDAVRHAREAGLVVAVTVCATRSFTTPENLLHYAEYVRSLGVAFIQVLEPKAVGRYQGRKVSLDWQQLQVLEDFYTTLNFDPRYKDYPVVLYHGYHQRRIGCLSAGSRNLYIDSEGFINACPFCQSRSYHVREVLHRGEKGIVPPIMCCPDYGVDSLH
ncbi:MAG TPA: radical SAM protein [Chitinophagaceae bacterium]